MSARIEIIGGPRDGEFTDDVGPVLTEQVPIPGGFEPRNYDRVTRPDCHGAMETVYLLRDLALWEER